MKIIDEILWRLKSYPYGIEHNYSMDETRNVCTRMFNRARKSIRIIAGTLHKDFYDSESISGSLERAAERGVAIEIMYGPGVTIEKHKISLLKDKGVKFFQLPQKPPRHLMSIDDKDVRVERSHEPAPEATNAIIYHDARSLAAVVGDIFEKLRNTAQPR